MTLRSALTSGLAAVLVATAVAATPASQHERCAAFMKDNPDLVCLSLETAKATDIKLATTLKRFGWTLGVGPGAALQVNDNWDTRFAPTPLFFGIVYGVRLK